MARVSQDVGDIKHLILLRKALLARKSLEIYSQNPSMRLTIGEGKFHGGDCINTVRLMIEKPVPFFDWDEFERKAMFIAQNPKDIFVRAIVTMMPDRDRLHTYKVMFSKLPRVRMRLNTVFRASSSMQIEYQVLYRLSLASEGASVKDYLIASEGVDQLRRRIGIVIASYCLGDFIYAERAVEKNPKTSVVSRILAHMRKLT
ncbi:MAG: hypothetical protein COS35_02370 [Zetaproteobacteria bacterium CG02_land_8_20_14_3_00_50_9]|nr:MAG: hypothetical protein COS35_02370 [Zetaproteobacteria bacterium CG02_land_8_20_14_3_00_50_9]